MSEQENNNNADESPKADSVRLSAVLGSAWIKEKPDYACVFLTRHKYKERFEYDIWEFAWTQGEPPGDREGDEDETRYYYLAWTDKDGEEWDGIKDCDFDEYLIIEILPTMDEVHKEWVNSFHASA